MRSFPTQSHNWQPTQSINPQPTHCLHIQSNTLPSQPTSPNAFASTLTQCFKHKTSALTSSPNLYLHTQPKALIHSQSSAFSSSSMPSHPVQCLHSQFNAVMSQLTHSLFLTWYFGLLCVMLRRHKPTVKEEALVIAAMKVRLIITRRRRSRKRRRRRIS